MDQLFVRGVLLQQLRGRFLAPLVKARALRDDAALGVIPKQACGSLSRSLQFSFISTQEFQPPCA